MGGRYMHIGGEPRSRDRANNGSHFGGGYSCVWARTPMAVIASHRKRVEFRDCCIAHNVLGFPIREVPPPETHAS